MLMRETTEKLKTLRRSPRFLPQNASPESLASDENPNPNSKNFQVKGDSNFALGLTPSVSGRESHKVSQEQVVSGDLGQSNGGLRRFANSCIGLRRSPRFLPPNASPVSLALDENPDPKSKNCQVTVDSELALGFTPSVSAKKSHKVSQEQVVSGGLSQSNDGLRRFASSCIGLRRSPRLSNAVIRSVLRRSPRFSNRGDIEESKSNGITKRVSSESVEPKRVLRSPTKLNDRSRKCTKSSSGSRKCPRVVAAGIQSLRYALRFSDVGKMDEPVKKISSNVDNRFMRCRLDKSGGPKKVSSNSSDSNNVSRKCAVSNTGLRKASRVSAAPEIQSLRRSLRFLKCGTADEAVEKIGSQSMDSEVLSGVGNDKVDIEIEGDTKVADVGEVNEASGTKRKRKEAKKSDVLAHGWTEEQESALQTAYFAAKPTPHFWKKVAKLVPGKSAQDCFDKIHSDHKTPPQPRPRSRAKKTEVSSPRCFSLSASKLLKSTEPKTRVSYNKRKSHLAQKNIRKLLQKHCQVSQDCEVDHFSVLENVILSTPKCTLGKVGLNEKSSLGKKKQHSRFGSSVPLPISSPPVLKQVKNQALHEKYITQLHCREAKRKAAASRATKSIQGKENIDTNCTKKLDGVRAAKSALVSDMQDAINQFQHKQVNAACSFSEFLDEDSVDCDNEGEDEL